jgi:hypothetical protein
MTITRLLLTVVVSVGLAFGCGQDTKRKDETKKAYEPPPQERKPMAPPADAAGRNVHEDEPSLVECVRECVQSSQMRAESPESIRAGCVQSCTEECVNKCVERAGTRGEAGDDTKSECEKSCKLG